MAFFVYFSHPHPLASPLLVVVVFVLRGICFASQSESKALVSGYSRNQTKILATKPSVKKWRELNHSQMVKERVQSDGRVSGEVNGTSNQTQETKHQRQPKKTPAEVA